MNFAVIVYYFYIGLFAFLVYYAIAWIYVQIGRYVFDYIIIPAFFPFVFFNWRYLKNNSELNSDKDHISILLCNDYMPERVLSYREDIPKLIKYFRKNNWAYKIYFRSNRETLRNVINNSKSTMVYILGHGQRHGVKISNNEVVYYCEFEKSPKKKFIAQLHCNHYGGKSLAEYISNNPINNFVTNKKLTSLGISNFINKVTKGEIHGAP